MTALRYTGYKTLHTARAFTVDRQTTTTQIEAADSFSSGPPLHTHHPRQPFGNFHVPFIGYMRATHFEKWIGAVLEKQTTTQQQEQQQRRRPFAHIVSRVGQKRQMIGMQLQTHPHIYPILNTMDTTAKSNSRKALDALFTRLIPGKLSLRAAVAHIEKIG